MVKRRIGILTGGGDVQPLNAVIYASQQACKKAGIELIGFRKGWQGVLESSYLPLTRKSLDPTVGAPSFARHALILRCYRTLQE